MIERVAMICVHSSPLDQPGTGSSGGMNVYVRALARALAASDVEVDIFTRSATTVQVVRDAPNVRVLALPIGPAGPLPKGAFGALGEAAAAAIAEQAGDEGRRYDVVHSHYWSSGLVGSLLAARWSVPLVHMFHTLSRVKSEFAGSPPDEVRAAGEQRVLDRADAIVVANAIERAQILDLYRGQDSRLVTIPCGIDPAPFLAHKRTRRRQVGDPFVVVALGRAERLKNFPLLLRAVAIAAARDPHFGSSVRVQLAGGPSSDDPEVMPELQRLAGDLGIADRVNFVGPVPHERVPELYAGADLCVVPSRYESFGLVALEAMAAGLPVVATRTGGLQVTVDEGVNGYLVPTEGAEALASCLLALWADPALCAQLGTRGLRAAQQYAWPVIADRIGCLYQALAAPVGVR